MPSGGQKLLLLAAKTVQDSQDEITGKKTILAYTVYILMYWLSLNKLILCDSEYLKDKYAIQFF